MERYLMKQPCPLCQSHTAIEFSQDEKREYYQCSTCKLVFVPSRYYLNEDKEKERYDLHTNNPEDLNYRKFLNRMFLPMNERIKKQSCGLDFGSGPGPTLSLSFEEAAFMTGYCDFA